MVFKTRFCQGISDISDSYSGFILDQWGVLHDGKKLYPGVMEVMEQLHARNKEVVILSNSGKRADANAERLEKVGLPRELYTHIVTAGEFVYQGLKNQNEGIFADLGKRVYIINRNDDTGIVDGLDLKVVHDIADADFLLIAGTGAPDKALEEFDPVLREATRRRIRGICANPDIYALMDGKTYYGAGQIAKRFASFGGVIDFIGKPYAPIFRHCLSLFDNALPGSTVVVGDSMPHDIMGGALLSIDTALIASGVHMKAFEAALEDPREKDKNLNALINNYGCKPNYLMNRFEWGKPLPDRKHKKARAKG